MANQQSQFGFKHIGFLSGGSPDYQQQPRLIQSTYSTQIGLGDPVVRSTTTAKYIIQATGTLATSTPIEGIFVGCSYTPSGLPPTWSPYWPGAAASDATGYVIDAPNALFLVATLQTAVTTTNLGQAINFTTGQCATTGGGYSIATIDQATATATGTTVSLLPFKIVQLYQGIGNGSDPLTNYNWAVVTFNFQTWKTGAGL